MKFASLLFVCVVVAANAIRWNPLSRFMKPVNKVDAQMDTLKNSLGTHVPQITNSLNKLSDALGDVRVGFSIGPETRNLIVKITEEILVEAEKYRGSYDLTLLQFEKTVTLCLNVQAVVDRHVDRSLTDLEILFSNIESYAAVLLSCLAFSLVFISMRNGLAQFVANLFDASLVFCSLTVTFLFGLFLTDSINLFMDHDLLVAICVVVCVAPLFLHFIYIIEEVVRGNGGNNNRNNISRRPRMLWKAYLHFVICTLIVVVSMSVLSNHDNETVKPGVSSLLLARRSASGFGEMARIIPHKNWEFDLPGGKAEEFKIKPGKYLAKIRGYANKDHIFGQLCLEKLITTVNEYHWEMVGQKPIVNPSSSDHFYGNTHSSAPYTLTDFVLLDVTVETTYRVNLVKRNTDSNHIHGLEVQLMRIA